MQENENQLRTKIKIVCISFYTGRGNQVAQFLSFLKLIKIHICIDANIYLSKKMKGK